MPQPRVRYDIVEDGIARLTLNRPEKRNAVDGPMALAIEAAIDAAEADPGVRVVLVDAVMGEGRPVFCAGHDLREVDQPEDASTTGRGGFAGITDRERTKPFIAVVDGLATSGGFQIVLACDIVLASTRAAFALAEVKWNLVAGGGGMFRLARMVGRPVAMDLLLTGEEITAQRAYEVGVVSRLVAPEELAALALHVARRVKGNGPIAVRASRRVAAAAESVDDPRAWALTNAAVDEVMHSDDLAVGLAAFGTGQPARFHDSDN